MGSERRGKVTAGASAREVAIAWLVATALSGIPSTVYAMATGGDPLEATRAAAAMIGQPQSIIGILLAAAVVHGTVSLFWTVALVLVLPARHVVATAVLASAAIAILDLLIIAPRFFPEVAALEFWPQFADHLMWGACVGATLHLCLRRRRARA